MALLARTRNGEKRILHRLYAEAQIIKRFIKPILITGLSAQHILVHVYTFADSWSGHALLFLVFKLAWNAFVAWVIARFLAEFWFDIRTVLSFFWQQLHKYIRGLKRIPPPYIRLYSRLSFWFFIYTSPIPRLIFIRAGPRPPRQSPFALFMQAPLLVAP